jgi:hypothetical protein
MPTQTIGKQTNCTLSYAKSGVNYTLKLWAYGIGHGFSVIATESAARKYRAFYPHQRAVDPFVITFQLKGYPHLRVLTKYLLSYMNAVTDSGSVAMTVNIPARNFLRQGVPTGGMVDQDQTASNLFSPQITFDSISDPLDTSVPQVSGISLGSSANDDAAKFFYPASVSTNDPNARGDSFYDTAPVIVPPNSRDDVSLPVHGPR